MTEYEFGVFFYLWDRRSLVLLQQQGQTHLRAGDTVRQGSGPVPPQGPCSPVAGTPSLRCYFSFSNTKRKQTDAHWAVSHA